MYGSVSPWVIMCELDAHGGIKCLKVKGRVCVCVYVWMCVWGEGVVYGSTLIPLGFSVFSLE